MSHKGKRQLTILFKATSPALVAEGDRLFASHASWMAETHPREGDLALLSYEISKGVEYTNPLDPTSEPTGNTFFVLTEMYESDAGVANHWKMGSETWPDFNAMVKWLGECESSVVHGCPVLHALW